MKILTLLLAPLLALSGTVDMDAVGPSCAGSAGCSAGNEPAPASTPVPATELVLIETALGSITVALEIERAPITAGNFLRYAEERRLDGITFYRVMRLPWGEQPSGLVQGGAQWDPTRILPPIPHEPTNVTGVKHLRGAISMGRLDPGSATADFSILVSDIEGLDADPTSDDPELRAGYAAFGYVVSGMEVVDAIYNVPIDPEKGEGFLKGEMIADPVPILSIRRVDQEAEGNNILP